MVDDDLIQDDDDGCFWCCLLVWAGIWAFIFFEAVGIVHAFNWLIGKLQ